MKVVEVSGAILIMYGYRIKENACPIFVTYHKSNAVAGSQNYEGMDFYYMGDMKPSEFRQASILDDYGKALPIVNILFDMKDEVEDCIYSYLESV